MSAPSPATPLQKDSAIGIQLRLTATHLLTLYTLIYHPPTPRLIALALCTYSLQMFGMEAGYHRYFSHRAFKTTRLFQALLACAAMSSGQRGVITWAANHRRHHQTADTPADPHSPVARSWWYAHVGWLWDERNKDPSGDNVKDWLRYPELVFLNRHHYLVTYSLIAVLFALGEWSRVLGAEGRGIESVLWGFVVPTMAVMHLSMLVNSVAHGRWGRAPFESGDQSRNLWWLGVLTFGTGWHNNHHAYPSAARAGLRWWEVDIAYYLLRALAALGVVWGLREFPERMRGVGEGAEG